MAEVPSRVRRLLTKRAGIAVSVTIIIIAAIAVGYSGIGLNESEEIGAVIDVSSSIVRVGEEIQFSSGGSKGDIVEWNWSFGDTSHAGESDVMHSYEEAGWFDVGLRITSRSGDMATSNITIGVQRNDVHERNELGEVRNVPRGMAKGAFVRGLVGPNVGDPTTYVSYDLINPVGAFTVQLGSYYTDPDGNYHQVMYVDEAIAGTGRDIHFEQTIDAGELVDGAGEHETYVQLNVFLWGGKYDGLRLQLDSEFPLDDLTFPT